jgi:hypothetical protein
MFERQLEYWPPGAAAPRPIRVIVSAPVQDVPTVDDPDWSCRVTIEGFDEPCSAPCYQVDAIGVLLAALAFADSEVRRLARGGRVTWLGNEDLGLPRMPSSSDD